MDPVHERGSMDPVHESSPWTPGPCFVLTPSLVIYFEGATFGVQFEYFATFWISPALWRFLPKSPISPKSTASKGPLLASNANRQKLAIFCHFRHCMHFWRFFPKLPISLQSPFSPKLPVSKGLGHLSLLSPALWRFLPKSPKSPFSPKSPASKGPLLASNSNRQRLAIFRQFRHFRHCMHFWT